MQFLQDLYQAQLEGHTHFQDIRSKQNINPDYLGKLCQIPPETGQFISLIAATAPNGKYLELGTSGGYSTLWLALAGRAINKKIITFEIDEKKIALARETFELAQVVNDVELIDGNILDHLPLYQDISFCFLDTSKDIYDRCYDMVIPNMVLGGIFLADNAISHAQHITKFLEKAATDRRMDAIIVPIGKGVLMGRKVAHCF